MKSKLQIWSFLVTTFMSNFKCAKCVIASANQEISIYANLTFANNGLISLSGAGLFSRQLHSVSNFTKYVQWPKSKNSFPKTKLTNMKGQLRFRSLYPKLATLIYLHSILRVTLVSTGLVRLLLEAKHRSLLRVCTRSNRRTVRSFFTTPS